MRSIIVTGGSRGIGLGIAKKLSSSGFHVICVSRTRSELLDTAIADTNLNGIGKISHFTQDLADIDALPDAARKIRKEYGSIYGLINNAGLGTSGLLCNMRESDIEYLLRINITSPVILTKHILRHMLKAKSGRIINISSIVAITGYQGISVYSATKSALTGFTRSLSREVGPLGITVNAVLPGFVDTEMTFELDDIARQKITRRNALRRLTNIEDVANMVDYLASDQAEGVTGSLMVVDAGTTA